LFGLFGGARTRRRSTDLDPIENQLFSAGALGLIAFDLYGRGFSDRPHVRYDAVLFNRQIDELLAALEINGPINWRAAVASFWLAIGLASSPGSP
jgi:pimeloyl-ACP methyl ester carboxylesterase